MKMNLKIDPSEHADITQEKLIKTFGIYGAINAVGIIKQVAPLNGPWKYWDGIEKKLVALILPTE